MTNRVAAHAFAAGKSAACPKVRPRAERAPQGETLGVRTALASIHTRRGKNYS